MMNKVVLTTATVLTIAGSLAFAQRGQAWVVNGEIARAVLSKMIEMTGRQPQIIDGVRVLSTAARVTCSDYGGGNVSCQIETK